MGDRNNINLERSSSVLIQNSMNILLNLKERLGIDIYKEFNGIYSKHEMEINNNKYFVLGLGSDFNKRLKFSYILVCEKESVSENPLVIKDVVIAFPLVNMNSISDNVKEALILNDFSLSDNNMAIDFRSASFDKEKVIEIVDFLFEEEISSAFKDIYLKELNLSLLAFKSRLETFVSLFKELDEKDLKSYNSRAKKYDLLRAETIGNKTCLYQTGDSHNFIMIYENHLLENSEMKYINSSDLNFKIDFNKDKFEMLRKLEKIESQIIVKDGIITSINQESFLGSNRSLQEFYRCFSFANQDLIQKYKKMPRVKISAEDILSINLGYESKLMQFYDIFFLSENFMWLDGELIEINGDSSYCMIDVELPLYDEYCACFLGIKDIQKSILLSDSFISKEYVDLINENIKKYIIDTKLFDDDFISYVRDHLNSKGFDV